MGTVLHRTTKELQKDVFTDSFDLAIWIINPDLSAVENVVKRHWKIDGDTVSEMSQSEKDAADAEYLPVLKNYKIYNFIADTRTAINERYASERQQTLSVLLAESRQFLYSLETVDFRGSGLNDLTFSGTFQGFHNLPCIEIKIDSVGDIDTFSVKNVGIEESSGNQITGNDQDLFDGLKIKLNTITGHTLNDRWILRVKRYTRVNRANYIGQALVWVLSVINFHYTKSAQIMNSTTVAQCEAISWDFSTLVETDPNVSIQAALTIQN